MHISISLSINLFSLVYTEYCKWQIYHKALTGLSSSSLGSEIFEDTHCLLPQPRYRWQQKIWKDFFVQPEHKTKWAQPKGWMNFFPFKCFQFQIMIVILIMSRKYWELIWSDLQGVQVIWNHQISCAINSVPHY